ncbi:MAG: hypothetical protein WA173_00955 [Pseudomonas sp.]
MSLQPIALRYSPYQGPTALTLDGMRHHSAPQFHSLAPAQGQQP